MKEYKILFTGSVGAGKTTAIGQISDVPPLVTDVRNTDRSVGALLSEDVRQGVVRICEGAWYDPAKPGEMKCY